MPSNTQIKRYIYIQWLLVNLYIYLYIYIFSCSGILKKNKITYILELAADSGASAGVSRPLHTYHNSNAMESTI